ncbi:MAG: hypothetical protein KAU95_00840 [Candidatus Aenigmarchaeota archaeon]|nr:hypothetical protein [Candidatus Aenigmarchaeota archaeon]
MTEVYKMERENLREIRLIPFDDGILLAVQKEDYVIVPGQLEYMYYNLEKDEVLFEVTPQRFNGAEYAEIKNNLKKSKRFHHMYEELGCDLEGELKELEKVENEFGKYEQYFRKYKLTGQLNFW